MCVCVFGFGGGSYYLLCLRCALLLNTVMLVGAFAVYLEPWHADIFDFLDLRKNHGKVCIS